MCLLAVDGQLQKEQRAVSSDEKLLTTWSKSLRLWRKLVSMACRSDPKAFTMPDLTEASQKSVLLCSQTALVTRHEVLMAVSL